MPFIEAGGSVSALHPEPSSFGRISVRVYARDPLSQAGVASQLRGRPEAVVLDDGESEDAAVAIVVADEVDQEAVRAVRAIQRNGCARVVLVATRLDDGAVLSAIEAGACGLLRRSDALPEQLAKVIVKADAGDGSIPSDLLGRLLQQIGQLQREVLAPRGLAFSGLSGRELDVLRLLADGLDTADVAAKLCYSERTVKNVIHDLTSRFGLRNRTHAVAYAVRQGLI